MNIAFKQWLIGLGEAALTGATNSMLAKAIDGTDFSIYGAKFWELALGSAVFKMALYINSTLSRNKAVEQALYTPPPVKPSEAETKT